jgi:hypothetical protein
VHVAGEGSSRRSMILPVLAESEAVALAADAEGAQAADARSVSA